MAALEIVKTSMAEYELGNVRYAMAYSPALNMRRCELCFYLPPQLQGKSGVPLVVVLHGVEGCPWDWVFRGGLRVRTQRMIDAGEIEPMDELFREGEKNGVAFLARVPLDSGALTGTWTEVTYSQWAKGDKRYSMYRGERFAETLKRVAALKKDVEPYYENLAEAAMRFCLSDPAVSIVIPGMRNPREVDLNLPYSDGKELPTELLEKLKSHRWKHSYYS